MNRSGELRRNTHHQMLVDVAVVLCRAYGAEHARRFLTDSGVAEHVIERVVSNRKMRSMMHW